MLNTIGANILGIFLFVLRKTDNRGLNLEICFQILPSPTEKHNLTT